MNICQDLIHLVIRIPKEEASFIYNILEANEGVCFYSTLNNSISSGYRDLELKTSPDLKNELSHIIAKLSETIPIQIIRSNLPAIS